MPMSKSARFDSVIPRANHVPPGLAFTQECCYVGGQCLHIHNCQHTTAGLSPSSAAWSALLGQRHVYARVNTLRLTLSPPVLVTCSLGPAFSAACL
jgi:hypothetical protein